MELREYLGELLFNLGVRTPKGWQDLGAEAREPTEP